MNRRWALPFGFAIVVVAQVLVAVFGGTLLTAPYVLGYLLLTLAGGLFIVAGTGETLVVGDRTVPWYRLVGLADVLLAVTMVVWSVADATDDGTTTAELLVLVASVGVALALGYAGMGLARDRSPALAREEEETAATTE
ncbi:hypothetical protein [Halomarina litorea]|uniref:hypothetical protein n=1 Tax=Halomarina litorea TaxID=2961595 RepID=UPI0020C4F27F|nr:hypothetical protein [Halomarina sp. BCD28]